jgi:hypothetical protein
LELLRGFVVDPALGNNDHGAGSEADKLLGDAAEQQARQLAASAPAYDNHFG